MWETSVNAYPTDNRENGGPICSTGPVRIAEGMSVDASGVLYVVTRFPGDKIGIQTFGPSCGHAERIFATTKGTPTDPAVDGTALYVTDVSNRVEVYDTARKGSSPVRKLSDTSVVEGIGLAVDSHHDLLWSSVAQPWMAGQVVLFSNGQMPGKVLQATRIGHDFPGGIVIDRSDNLLLVDQTDSSIYVYAPPYHAPPFSVIPLKGTAVYCALASNQTRLYCMDYQYGSVDAYTYPGGRYLYSYTNGIKVSQEPIGIAIQPASLRDAAK